MTPFQKKIYSLCLESKRSEDKNLFNDNLFSLLDILRKICNHVDLLAQNYVTETEIFGSQQDEENMLSRHSKEEEEDEWKDEIEEIDSNRKTTVYPFLKQFFEKENYKLGKLAEGSSKMNLLMFWIQGCIALNEKMLIFSQWTTTLDLMETFLKAFQFHDHEEQPIIFKKNQNYLRLDGQTTNRQQLMDKFNEPDSPFRLFLISTCAGGLGLNLTGATRVLIYDVMLNPVNDFQACCR